MATGVLSCPCPAATVAAWTDGMHHEEFVPRHDHVGDLNSRPRGQILEEHLDKLDFVMVIQKVGQPIGGVGHVAGEEAIVGASDEFHLALGAGRHGGLRRRGAQRIRLAAEDESEAATERRSAGGLGSGHRDTSGAWGRPQPTCQRGRVPWATRPGPRWYEPLESQATNSSSVAVRFNQRLKATRQ